MTIKELGGWAKGDGADHIYDHGLEKERYRAAQRKIVACLVDQGYLGDEECSQRARDETDVIEAEEQG